LFRAGQAIRSPGASFCKTSHRPQTDLAINQMRTVDDLGFFSGKPMSKRSVIRNRVLKSATIEFGGGALTCTVRNWSDTGAMLDISPIGIPEHFTLLGPGGRRRPCRLVWQKEKRIGVLFE